MERGVFCFSDIKSEKQGLSQISRVITNFTIFTLLKSWTMFYNQTFMERGESLGGTNSSQSCAESPFTVVDWNLYRSLSPVDVDFVNLNINLRIRVVISLFRHICKCFDHVFKIFDEYLNIFSTTTGIFLLCLVSGKYIENVDFYFTKGFRR